MGQIPVGGAPTSGANEPPGEQVDEPTRKKLAHAGISQGTDGNYYDNADPSNPMTLEEAKAKAEKKVPGSFPESAQSGTGQNATADDAAEGPPGVPVGEEPPSPTGLPVGG